MSIIQNRFISYIFLFLFSFHSAECTCFVRAFDKPKIGFKRIDMQDLSLSGVDLKFTILVDNPNSIGLTVKTLFYRLDIEGKKVIEGHKNEKIEIFAKKVNEIEIPVSVDFAGLYDSLAALFQKDKIAYELTGYLVLDTPIGEMKFDFEEYEFHKGEIPVPDVPEIKVQEIRIVDFSFTNIDIDLLLQIKNTNDFSIKVRELRYLFRLNDLTVSKAIVESSSKLEQGEIVNITIPINLKISSLHVGILNALKQRKIKYKFLVNLILESTKGEIKLPLKDEGTIPLIKSDE